MRTHLLTRGCGLLAALSLVCAGANAQFADYTRRVPVTIKNNGSAATPTPTSAEVLLPLDSAMRPDRLDLRVGFNNGTTTKEIDSKIFRAVQATPPTLTENMSAGKTDYASLPAGTQLTFGGTDDSSVVVTLPFSFPFVDNTSNKLTVGIDGYAAPGENDPGRNDNPDGAKSARIIMPWDSDLAITGPGQGVWYATDNAGPGGTARAIVRWEVQDSGGSGTTIAKMALILTANGDIRFVYGDPVNQPPSAVTGYAPVKVGIGVGYSSVSNVNTPTTSFTNHDDILYTQVLGTSGEAARVVFRLQQPISAGATSTGQYFVYYGNPSPNLDADRDVKDVFDYVVDFSDPKNVVGQPAPDWDVQTGNTVTVENYQGGKVGVLRRGTQNHPRATVKQGAMPAFLNPEILAHVAPKGGGEREMAPMSRVVSDPNDPFFQGGYGYATDGFGANSAIVSYINPATDAGPALMASTPDLLQADQYENVLYRVTGDPGLIQGKNWTDGDQEPAGWMLQANRADFTLTHGSTTDPAYNQPGTTGMAGYLQDIAMDYIALRELRDLGQTAGAAQTLTPTGPFIQGTISSSKASLNPLTIAEVHITGPNGYDESFAVGPDGHFRVSLPAGSYTVKASAKYHAEQTAANVSPTAGGQTNIVLPYTGATVQGSVRDVFTGQAYAGMTVVAVDTEGDWQGSAVTDSNGHYSLMVEDAGALSVAALAVGIDSGDPRSGLGQRKTINNTPDTITTVDFQVAPPLNGDFEIPNQAGTTPLGWSTNPFTPGNPPGTYTLTTDQNHTPGGRYSVAVTNATAQFEAWIPANFQWATVNPNANYTVSMWVYFTQAGQRARLRVRTLDSTGADINIAQPSGGAYITAGAPDASGGLQATVGQWTKVEVTVPADPRLAKMDNRLYVSGPSGGGIATGTVYIDDYAFTATPVAQALGKLVDADGNPVAGAYVGPLGVQDLTTGEFDVWQGPYSVTDADGNFGIYPAQTGDVPIAAFKLPAASNGTLPDFGYVVDPATGTLNATATPGARQTVRLLASGNVADGAAASAQDLLGNPMNGSGGGAIASAVDNSIATRWDSGGVAANGLPVTATFVLPKVEQVDQIEILWEYADASDIDISIDDGSGAYIPVVSQAGAEGLGIASGSIDYSGFREGVTQIIRFPAARPVKGIQIGARAPRSGLNNFSIIELRALSIATVPVLPITNADVEKALKIAGGILAATQPDITRLDKDSDGKITVLDAAALRRSIP